MTSVSGGICREISSFQVSVIYLFLFIINALTICTELFFMVSISSQRC